MNTFYKYFRDKEQLLNEIYRGLRDLLEDILDESISEGENPRAQFHELWVEMAAFHRKRPKVIPFLETHHQEPYPDEASRALARVPPPISDLVDRLCRDKIAKNVPVIVLSAVVWGAFLGLIKSCSQAHLSLSEETLKAAEDCTWDAIRVAHSESFPGS